MWFLNKNNKIKGDISILIPTRFDSRYIIELCLKSINKNTDYSSYQIIVCDSDVDEETRNYLSDLASKGEIKLIKATDPKRPKDDLANAVNTEYYILMHDDIKITKRDWLSKRLVLMNRDKNNAIVGSVVQNYHNQKRFFPLGLLVKTEVSRELNLIWGKQEGFDTGGIAYQVFFSQKKYKFVPYKTTRDIYHFSDMTWPMRKYYGQEFYPNLQEKIKERDKKIELIHKMLERDTY